MGIAELLAMAASFSLLAGWRLYAAVLVAGAAMRLDLVALPSHLSALAVLEHPLVLGAAAIGALAEFLADKLALVDSLWDAVHSVIRPLGGALLALAIVDPGDPAIQAAVFLLGGGAAFASHAAKAGTRVAVNTSPEPVSNVLVSTAEDVAVAGGLALAVTYPWVAAAFALLLLAAAWWLVLRLRRLVARAGAWLSR
jgi:hypothetical protein